MFAKDNSSKLKNGSLDQMVVRFQVNPMVCGSNPSSSEKWMHTFNYLELDKNRFNTDLATFVQSHFQNHYFKVSSTIVP